MTINEYQRDVLRTESQAIETCITDSRLLQGLLGLSGEAGECVEILKKHLFQAHWFDREQLAKELGDVAFYLALSADAIGYSFEDILQMNVDKRQKRYPQGFDIDRSIHRPEYEGGTNHAPD